MRRFQIEHVGLAVADPKAAAEWYHRVLGFEILHLVDGREGANAFLRDGSGTVIELWRNPDTRAVAADLTHHLQVHVALRSESPLEDARSLVEQGAELVEIAAVAPNGDQTISVRDPWGNCIQLARRGAGSFFRRLPAEEGPRSHVSTGD